MTDAPSPATRRPPGVGPALWIGLLVVLAAAAALSFDTLRDLAVAVRIPDRLAPLLPIAIDAGAAVSSATWLSRRVDEETARFARRTTSALLALTVIGNAAQLGMHAHDIAPPWWIAVAVGAVPPGVVGATVHLLVLVSRSRRSSIPTAPHERQVVDTRVRRDAERLVADGAGRPRVAAELGLTDHQARRLVLEIRRGDHGTTTKPTTGRNQGDHTATTAPSSPTRTTRDDDTEPDRSPSADRSDVTWNPKTASSTGSASCSPRPRPPERPRRRTPTTPKQPS